MLKMKKRPLGLLIVLHLCSYILFVIGTLEMFYDDDDDDDENKKR